jgi:hypothetical protein
MTDTSERRRYQREDHEQCLRNKMASLPKGEKVVLLIDGDNQVADVAVPPGQNNPK